ncbi:9531_t:CDS:2 [Paraglomus occultum]|uniref:Protein-lysine N-methyltransferase EFM5 n=1 Tax=Paraglomus occultum TaxID=144539 RepID=A0A9N8W5T2_9GLOM|nr:9531_t:CDS:2 [Paraglomus occultum]
MADKPSPTQEPTDDNFPLYRTARIHDNDEIPAYAREILSSQTLSALEEFLKERKQAEENLERLREQKESGVDDVLEKRDRRLDELDVIGEDWQVGREGGLSQFWYDENTINTIVEEVIDNTPSGGRIACISTPTVFIGLKRKCPSQSLYLFEYDTRFSMYGTDFIHYDYNNPQEFRDKLFLRGTVDYIVVDPPFLSVECLAQTMLTVDLLKKENGCKIMVCTGATMSDIVYRLSQARRTVFEPRHRGNRLKNEFRCHLNYESEKLHWDESQTFY